MERLGKPISREVKPRQARTLDLHRTKVDRGIELNGWEKFVEKFREAKEDGGARSEPTDVTVLGRLHLTEVEAGTVRADL